MITILWKQEIILFVGLTTFLWSAAADAGTPVPKTKTVPAATAKQSENPFDDPWVMLDGKLRWSAQERLRFESRENNFDFDSSRNALTDDSFFLQRFRLGLTAQPLEGMTLMGEGQDSREFGSARPNIPGSLGAEGDDEWDLRQAWILLGQKAVFPVSLKAGRMTLKYGDERLVGDSDWNNFGRTFDAVVARVEWGGSWLDVFFGSPVLIKPTEFNPDDGHDRLAGAYFSTQDWLDQNTEFYLFYRNHDNSVNNGQPQETWTPGVRFKSMPGKYGNWGYELELAGQAGEVAVPQSGTTPTRSIDHLAFASHLQGSYTWNDLAFKPALGALYDFASGDSSPTDAKDTSFQNLFPTNHKFYGSMDLFSWRNLHDLGLSLSAKPAKDITARVDIHSF